VDAARELRSGWFKNAVRARRRPEVTGQRATSLLAVAAPLRSHDRAVVLLVLLSGDGGQPNDWPCRKPRFRAARRYSASRPADRRTCRSPVSSENLGDVGCMTLTRCAAGSTQKATVERVHGDHEDRAGDDEGQCSWWNGIMNCESSVFSVGLDAPRRCRARRCSRAASGCKAAGNWHAPFRRGAPSCRRNGLCRSSPRAPLYVRSRHACPGQADARELGTALAAHQCG